MWQNLNCYLLTKECQPLSPYVCCVLLLLGKIILTRVWYLIVVDSSCTCVPGVNKVSQPGLSCKNDFPLDMGVKFRWIFLAPKGWSKPTAVLKVRHPRWQDCQGSRGRGGWAVWDADPSEVPWATYVIPGMESSQSRSTLRGGGHGQRSWY